MNIFEIIEKYFPDLKAGDVLPSHGQTFRSILYESHRDEYQAILETAPAFGNLVGDYVEGEGSQILQVIANHFTDYLQDNIELLEIEKEPQHISDKENERMEGESFDSQRLM